MYRQLLSLIVVFTLSLTTRAQLSLDQLIQSSEVITNDSIIQHDFGAYLGCQTQWLYPPLSNQFTNQGIMEYASVSRTPNWTNDIDTTATYIFVGAHSYGWESVIYAGGTRNSNYNSYFRPNKELPLFNYTLIKGLVTPYFQPELNNNPKQFLLTSLDKDLLVITLNHIYPYGNQTSWENHHYYFFKRFQ